MYKIMQYLSKIKGKQILVVGDLMLDIYLYGSATRISPEAPVPVVTAQKEYKTPGGSANVIYNLCKLGCLVTGAGYIGNDSAGDFLIKTFSCNGINTEAIIISSFHTIHKTRVLANGQHIVRFDYDSDFSKLVKDKKKLIKCISDLAECDCFDAVVISDYCKGTITLELMNSLKKHFSCPIICDTKPQNKDWFYNTFCITPNIVEAQQMLGIHHNVAPDFLARTLKKDMNLKSIIITMANDGILCLDEFDELYSWPAHVIIDNDSQRRFDVTGAGDTVISVFSACIAAGLSIKDAVLAANIAAGIVVCKTGTALCNLDELISECEIFFSQEKI